MPWILVPRGVGSSPAFPAIDKTICIIYLIGMTLKHTIKEKIDLGWSYKRIAKELSCSTATISYHVRKNNWRPIDDNGQIRHDWSRLQMLYDDGMTYHDLYEETGVTRGSIFKAIKRGDFTPRSIQEPLENWLVKDHRVRGHSHLKTRLLDEGVIENSCSNSSCILYGITDPKWAGKPLVLHLDHINGVNNDNRIENLRLLCPNCHSQSETYAGRNANKIRS